MGTIVPIPVFIMVVTIIEFVFHFNDPGNHVNLGYDTSRHKKCNKVYLYLSIKKGVRVDPCVDIVTVSGEVRNTNTSVILVAVRSKCLSIRCAVALYNEWVSDHTVASLEANLRLEGARIDASEHL